MIKIGFTGTHLGMTDSQQTALHALIEAMQPAEFHHGDCIGADAQAHAVVKQIALRCRIVIHPPIRNDARAFCTADVELASLSYIKRNRQIVVDTARLVATPFEHEEQRRGGTWSTVRFARQHKRHTILIGPDGTLLVWNAPGAGSAG